MVEVVPRMVDLREAEPQKTRVCKAVLWYPPPALSLPQVGLLRRNSVLTFIGVDRGGRWWPGRQCSPNLPPISTTVTSFSNEGDVVCCVGV